MVYIIYYHVFPKRNHLPCLGDASAERDRDPEGDLDVLPGDDLQLARASSPSNADLLEKREWFDK